MTPQCRRLVRIGRLARTGLLVMPLLAQGSAEAAVPVPERPITDPRSVTSPTNAAAAPVSLGDVSLTRAIADAAWSADGKQIFLSTDLTGRYNLWRVDAEGGWPVQLTQSDEAQRELALSPDGRTLVFTQDVGGDEAWDLYSVPTAGGEVARLTRTRGGSVFSPRFSPDGKQLAVHTKSWTDPVISITLLELATGKTRLLTREPSPDHHWYVVDWTPDGRSLFANRSGMNLEEGSVWRIDADTGSAEPVAGGKAGVYVVASGLSPDGRLLAITSNEATGQMRAGILDLASGRARWLDPTPWEQRSGSFSPDGRSLVVRTNEGGRTWLAVADVASGRVRPLPFPPGFDAEATSVTTPFSPDSRRMLVAHAAANTPLDLWSVELGAMRPRRVTSLSVAGFDPERLPRSQIVTYRSFDATPIGAILTIPFNLKQDGSNPAIVLPHGGPTFQAQDWFDGVVAALASRGFMVIQPNFRGSTGYGRAFQRANVGDLGNGDLRDVLAARDFLIATGYVDPRKVGIMGASYGGYMTLLAVGRAPDAFAAGVQAFGITDFLTLMETGDPLMQQYILGLLGDPAKDRARYEAASPMTTIRQARAPLLSLQGERDGRVPRSQAQELADVLKARGTEVETVFYPGEGHGFHKRENQADALRRTVEWFERHLAGKPAPAR